MFFMERAQELIEVVTALRNANDALLEATTSGDGGEATRLLQDIVVLERRGTVWYTRATRISPGPRPRMSPRSLFGIQVIQALRLMGRPSSARLVSDVTKSRWAERVDTAKLSSLRRDEARSWRKISRSYPDDTYATSTSSQH